MTDIDNSGEQRRRPGRPEATGASRDELLEKGLDRFVRRGKRVDPGMPAESLARHLGCKPSTLADRFGLTLPDGTRTRRRPVQGFFDALRELAVRRQPLDAQVGLAERSERFLAEVGNAFGPVSDERVKAVLDELPGQPVTHARQQLARLAGDLGHVPDNDERAASAVQVLRIAWTQLPADVEPGTGLQLELDAIDAFSAARARPRGPRAWGRVGWHWINMSSVVPALNYHDPDLVVLALKSQARGRHGVPLDAVLSCIPSDLRAPRSLLLDLVRLAAARGYCERGEFTAALDVLPEDCSDALLLFTLVQLWHAAVVESDDPGRRQIAERIRQRLRAIEASFTDPETGEWFEDADVDDAGLDEALALAEGDDGARLMRLTALVSEQLTDQRWRTTGGPWSPSQSVEVLCDELERRGRPHDAEQLARDLLFVTGLWGTDGADLFDPRQSLPDRRSCGRLALRYPDAVPNRDSRDRWVHHRVDAGTDAWTSSSRRLHHGGDELPAIEPERLLDALLLGDAQLSRRAEDVLRKIGWLLDLRAAERD